MSETYSATVIRASKELTKKEQLQIRDTAGALSLDKESQAGSLDIMPDLYALVGVHNDKAKDDKDYQQLVIVDKDGYKWYTGSRSFIDSFLEIAGEMDGESEAWGVRVIRRDSKNYSGKTFLTCTVI